MGSFLSGTVLQVALAGHGDLIDANFQVKPDGSLFAPATGGAYTYINEGAVYPKTFGGDGINHFVGGGANFDTIARTFPFAGKQTTDTRDPLCIRAGAVVGTFSSAPVRSDWFFLGYGSAITVPEGKNHLYVAVNETFSPNDHGSYSGTLLVVAAAPEPGTFTLVGFAIVPFVLGIVRRRK